MKMTKFSLRMVLINLIEQKCTFDFINLYQKDMKEYNLTKLYENLKLFMLKITGNQFKYNLWGWSFTGGNNLSNLPSKVKYEETNVIFFNLNGISMDNGLWDVKGSLNILPVTGDCSSSIVAIRVKLLAQNWCSFFILFCLSQYFDHCNGKNLIRVQNYSFNIFLPWDYFLWKSYFYFISSQSEIIEPMSL